jgi:hypothetical protein
MDVLSMQRAGGEDACGEVGVLRAETEVVVQEGGPVGSAGEGRNQHRGEHFTCSAATNLERENPGFYGGKKEAQLLA